MSRESVSGFESFSPEGFKSFILIVLFVGLIYARSSFGKFASGNFPQNLGETLGRFSSKNPYPWYREFLESVAIPNSQTIGVLVMWGELFVAVALVGGSLYFLTKKFSRTVAAVLIIGLFIGALLNLVFWLASSWTSPSTDSLNLLMFSIEVIAIVTLLKFYKNQET